MNDNKDIEFSDWYNEHSKINRFVRCNTNNHFHCAFDQTVYTVLIIYPFSIKIIRHMSYGDNYQSYLEMIIITI